ncbi:hypothetical protein BSLA_02f0895 [Burkholderia stabilis]|nr:hypothetical protein BSLA_02f0895 [Burkholderia stabilis]
MGVEQLVSQLAGSNDEYFHGNDGLRFRIRYGIGEGVG